MDVKLHDSYIIVRLKTNENLLQSLINICETHQIRTGVILSGIGRLKNITLGYFKGKGEYMPKRFVDPFELLSLSGTLIRYNGIIYPHVHAVIGSIEKETYGGHLIDATVDITNEIILLEIPIGLTRIKSRQTGLMELSLKC